LDNGRSNGGGSFKVDNGSDVELTNVHRAGTREIGDEIAEREMRNKE